MHKIKNYFSRIAQRFGDKRIFTPKVVPIVDTIGIIIKQKKSLSRFGDGEFLIALNECPLQYQRLDKKLAKRLREILISNDENILIAIEDCFGDLNHLSDKSIEYYKTFLPKMRNKMCSLLDINKIYHSSQITRPYKIMRDKSRSGECFDQLKKIWKSQDVLMVEGNMSRLGVGNDLFQETKSFKRIIAPSKSAFDQYEKIFETIKKHCTKNHLVLIALGPTASVLAHDLAKNGFWALDIGNIDLDYEWYLKKDETFSPIKNKFVWCEKNGGDVSENYEDEKYLSEIIEII